MNRVGVRELRQNLSMYLRRVRRGNWSDLTAENLAHDALEALKSGRRSPPGVG